mgnify:CR=1 FL=1
MVRARKDFFMLAVGIASFVLGLVFIGNFIPKNWWAGGVGIFLVVLGVYLTGMAITKNKK